MGCGGITAIELIGSCIALCGALISVMGTVYNNVFLQHDTAMWVWRWSNYCGWFWSVGFMLRFWTDGLAGAAWLLMYSVYIISNEYGLWKKKRDGNHL